MAANSAVGLGAGLASGIYNNSDKLKNKISKAETISASDMTGASAILSSSFEFKERKQELHKKTVKLMNRLSKESFNKNNNKSVNNNNNNNNNNDNNKSYTKTSTTTNNNNNHRTYDANEINKAALNLLSEWGDVKSYTAERLRRKHIQTLEVMQLLVYENALLKEELDVENISEQQRNIEMIEENIILKDDIIQEKEKKLNELQKEVNAITALYKNENYFKEQYELQMKEMKGEIEDMRNVQEMEKKKLIGQMRMEMNEKDNMIIQLQQQNNDSSLRSTRQSETESRGGMLTHADEFLGMETIEIKTPPTTTTTTTNNTRRKKKKKPSSLKTNKNKNKIKNKNNYFDDDDDDDDSDDENESIIKLLKQQVKQMNTEKDTMKKQILKLMNDRNKNMIHPTNRNLEQLKESNELLEGKFLNAVTKNNKHFQEIKKLKEMKKSMNSKIQELSVEKENLLHALAIAEGEKKIANANAYANNIALVKAIANANDKRIHDDTDNNTSSIIGGAADANAIEASSYGDLDVDTEAAVKIRDDVMIDNNNIDKRKTRVNQLLKKDGGDNDHNDKVPLEIYLILKKDNFLLKTQLEELKASQQQIMKNTTKQIVFEPTKNNKQIYSFPAGSRRIVPRQSLKN